MDRPGSVAGITSRKGRPHASWKLGGGARSFAVTATLFLSAACSGTATERLAGTSTPTPSAAASGATTLEGHIVGDSDHPGYTVEVPDGWSTEDGGFIVKEGPDALGLSVWDVGEVPRHPCRWQGTETEPGPTVDDLVEVLTSQRLRDATAPSEVMLAGHEGLYLEWSVPDDWIVTGDSAFQGCDDAGDFVSWWGKDAGQRYQQVAGQVDRLWILDVEGQTLLVDATYSPDTSAADREELEHVVASLRFIEE
jgi:hypothetical protein